MFRIKLTIFSVKISPLYSLIQFLTKETNKSFSSYSCLKYHFHYLSFQPHHFKFDYQVMFLTGRPLSSIAFSNIHCRMIFFFLQHPTHIISLIKILSGFPSLLVSLKTHSLTHSESLVFLPNSILSLVSDLLYILFPLYVNCL